MAGLRNFAITFVLCLLLFGVSGYFMLGVAQSYMETIMNADYQTGEESGDPESTDENAAVEDETKEGDPSEVLPEPEGDTFTALILGFDSADESAKKKSEIDAVMLVKVHKEQKKLIYLTVPNNMRLYVNGNYLTITDVYRYKGIEFLTNKITGITGLKINYYVSVGMQGIIGALDQLGPLNYNVPVDMTYTPIGAEKPEFSIKQGRQNLTGQQVRDIMRFKSYQTGNGEVMRTNVQRSVLLEICKQKLVPASIPKAPQVFDALVKNINTNFTAADLVKNIELIFAIKDFTTVDLKEYPTISKEVNGVIVSDPSIDRAIAKYMEYR